VEGVGYNHNHRQLKKEHSIMLEMVEKMQNEYPLVANKIQSVLKIIAEYRGVEEKNFTKLPDLSNHKRSNY
jgi:hypothetical protein